MRYERDASSANPRNMAYGSRGIRRLAGVEYPVAYIVTSVGEMLIVRR